MKKKYLRLLSALFGMVMLVSMLAACGGGASSGGTDAAPDDNAGTTGTSEEAGGEAGGGDLYTEIGTYPIVNEPIEMTMFCLSAANVIDWATNDFTLYMEEKTGIKWNFIQATVDSYTEKINLLISSGDYPDVFMFQVPDVAQYGVKEGILIPLDELIPEYMPNYWGYMQENEAYWNQQRQTDGHIYGVASINICYHCSYYNKMWVNMEYIEEIGLGVPETTDEFIEVCKAFLELYPNGVPVTGSTTGWGEQFYNFLLGSFITNPGQRSAGGAGDGDYLLVSPEGNVVTAANQDEYREYLRFMSEMYDMGLIYDGGFTQNDDQYRSLVNQPDAPVLFLASGAISNSVDATVNPDLYRNFRAIAPLEGPNGAKIATQFKYNDIQENKLVITDKCEYPEAVLRWADHFYTLEGYLQYQYGDNTDGEDWILNPEGEVGLDGTDALYRVKNLYTSEPQNHDWQDLGLIFAPEWVRFGEAADADVDIGSAEGLEKLLLIETQEKYEPYAQDPATQFDVLPNRVKLTSEESDSIQTIAVELEKYIMENMVAFITGSLDVESDWDSYIAGFDNIGLPEYLEVYQGAWDRQSGK